MTTKKKEDKPIIFTCDCGHYGFMEVDYFEDEGFCFSFIEEPHGLIQRVKCFFKSKRYVSDIFLTRDDVKDLIEYLFNQFKE